MTEELLKLAHAVCKHKGWTESYLARSFGHGTIMENIRRNTVQFSTAERFKAWLEQQLKEPVKGSNPKEVA